MNAPDEIATFITENANISVPLDKISREVTERGLYREGGNPNPSYFFIGEQHVYHLAGAVGQRLAKMWESEIENIEYGLGVILSEALRKATQEKVIVAL